MIIKLKLRKRWLRINAKKCNFLGMFRGLMFRRRENAPILLFNFKKPVGLKIHSWFVFFPFLAIWLDDKNKILEIREVKPWKFCFFPKQRFCKLIEIPISKRYRKIIRFLDES